METDAGSQCLRLHRLWNHCANDTLVVSTCQPDLLKTHAAYQRDKMEWFQDKWLTPNNVGVDLIGAAISSLSGAVKEAEVIERRARMNPPPTEPHTVDWEWAFRHAGYSINELMTVLEHECPKLPFLAVTRTRAFDTTILMQEAEKALSDSAQKRLDPFWLEGWREAGRCLAFDAPTAAAFQMLRVTEGIIKRYRRLVAPTEQIPDSDGLSDHINAIKKASVSETVVGALRSLKTVHRNPTMHPGKNWNSSEATTLFGLCIGAIDFISADMDGREKAVERKNESSGAA